MDLRLHPGGFDSAEPTGSGIPAGTLFVRTATHLRGPFNVSVLRNMQARGEILPDTLLSPDRARWVTASSLPELFPAGQFVRLTPMCDQERLWHVMIEGRRQGPMSWETLCQLAESGTLRDFDRVTVDGGDHWVPANSISGLPLKVPSTQNPLVDSRRSWLIGGGIASVVLIMIPVVTILIWNEKRIGWDENRFDVEDDQAHSQALEASRNATQLATEAIRAELGRDVARIEGEATTEAARLNAAATGAEIARDERRHTENVAAMNSQTQSIQNAAAASTAAAAASSQAADASRESANASRESVDASRDAEAAARAAEAAARGN